MQKNMPKLGVVLMIAAVAAWVGGWGTPASAQKAFVEVTGQTTSYAPGDDGDIQTGVQFPAARFHNNRDGTVTDNLTNLIWLKDASCLGAHKWEDIGPVFPALAAVAALNAGEDFSCADYVAGTFTDWRLPNFKELHSLIDFGFVDPALSNAAGTGQCTATDCAFAGVQLTTAYWSSTTGAAGPNLAWNVHLTDGFADADLKDDNIHLVWPVRRGQ